MTRPRHQHEAGFTLVELMITLVISGAMLGAMVSFFVGQRQFLGAQEQATEMLQNARVAMDIIAEDVRLAGYGAPRSQFGTWITWVTPTLTSNPQITPGAGTTPAAISIIGAVDAPDVALATITVAVAAGAITLSLVAGQGSAFNTSTKKLIFIGNENAVITNVAGDTLTIAKPVAGVNPGLACAYPVKTAIALVKVITYRIDANTLKRDENTGGNPQPVAENIENLQITPPQPPDNFIIISLTARTAKPDPRYKHPTTGDHYRRRILYSKIQLRNLSLPPSNPC